MKERNPSNRAATLQITLWVFLISISAILLVFAASIHAGKVPDHERKTSQPGRRAGADSITALGNYPNASTSLSGNTTVTPDAAPTDTTSITVSTNSNFNGTFAANPTTGVVTVTDAHPAGTYSVTVTALGPKGTTSKTFTLTVTSTPCGAGLTAGFIPAGDVFVFSDPVFVAIGDFNEDGVQDLAVARYFHANAVSIRLGDGLGGFTGSTEVSTGEFTSPSSIAIGDFNGDGHQDLAITAGNTVAIRLGDGLAGFTARPNVIVGIGPHSVAIGDFNGDGIQDLAIADSDISIRLGDGMGGFGGSTEVNVGNIPSSVAIGDFNGDAIQDLAIPVSRNGSSGVAIRLGDGSGGFSGSTEVPMGSDPYLSLAIGDLNGDGKQDLAVAKYSFGGSSTVAIRLGDGMGSFTGSTEVSVGFQPESVAIGDFNGDGKQDLVVATASETSVSIRLGDGMGGFNSSMEVSVGNGPFSVAIGDFNGDGVQDLAVAMFQDSSGAVAIRLGQCTPVATPTPTATPTPISTPGPPMLGDYPSTASIQLSGNTTVTPNAAPTDTTSVSVSTTTSFKGTLAASPMTGVITVTNAHPAGVYTVTVTAVGPAGSTTKTFALTVTGNPCGAGLTVGFTHAADVHTGNNPYSVAIGDFNRDGKQDLAIANVTNGGISIRLGNGLGEFSGLTGAGSVGNPHSVAIGDLNGDGLQDLAVAAADIGGNIPIDLGDGLGGFSYIRNVTVGSAPWSIAIGDFNRDGKQDFAVANLFEATVSIRLGDGFGGFISPTEINEGGAAIAIGDFNGDGKQDLVLTLDPDIISIRLGDGLGGFGDPTHVSVGSSPRSVAIGDFNGDGRPDLAVGNAGSGTVSIRLGDGSGDFSGSIEVTVGFSPSSIAIGDFNGDGIQDLAVANYDSDTVSIRLGDGTGGFSGSTEIYVDANPSSVAVGDFNEDGVQDLAVANYLSYPGIVSILLGQCVSAATPTPIPSPPAAAQSINLSTRMRVETGDSVAIGGFIITGKVPKRVIVRGIGPSLIGAGIANTLADPRMELHGPAGFTTIANENWRDTQEAEIIATGLAPTHNLEPAIVATLAPGGYTAIVGGGYEPTGVALVEVYDLDLSAVSKLTNISTRTPVNTGDEIVIGGFILGNGTMPDSIILRGIGPSLASFGVPNPLANPTLELRDLNGVLIRANDNWQADPAQAALIIAAGLAPTDSLESGIAATLAPGPYTALLSGVNDGTGVGLVEVYNLGAP